MRSFILFHPVLILVSRTIIVLSRGAESQHSQFWPYAWFFLARLPSTARFPYAPVSLEIIVFHVPESILSVSAVVRD